MSKQVNQRLNSTETVLIGNWIENDAGNISQDEACDRIEWLTSSVLEKISVDSENWTATYRDPDDGRFWVLSYPQSHMQGGGPPRLDLAKSDV